jgi:type VI secretion system protein ImpJ
MADSNRVVWSQGMFVFPQHYQQQDRCLENLINSRCLGLRPYDWGFYTLAIDHNLLKIGKVGLKECRGIFPDGTPFNLPDEDPLPVAVDIPEDVQDEMVFLALPLRRRQAVEIDSEMNPDGLARFRIRECEIRDCNCGAEGRALLQLGSLKTHLLLQREERSGYTTLGVGRVMEVTANKNVLLDSAYIPSNLNCAAMPNLGDFLRELYGILNTRGDMLARDLTKPGYGGVAEVVDFLLLQLINRNQPLLKHFSNMEGLHPEDFYRIAIQLAGELATFFREETRPVSFPSYDHYDLQSTFSPIMDELRTLLARERMRRATRIELSKPKAGYYAARLTDKNLLDTAIFVLAVKAQIPSDKLRMDFPLQTKIGPVEEIRDWVGHHLPGIPIEALPVAPKELPYRTGFTYFELDKRSEHWKKMKVSGGFGLWIGGLFPDLALEFWAIMEG